jgi:hypothetical protein
VLKMKPGYYLMFHDFNTEELEFITGPSEHAEYPFRHQSVRNVAWTMDGDTWQSAVTLRDGAMGTYNITYWTEDSL